MSRLPLKDAIREMTECEPLPPAQITRLQDLQKPPEQARRRLLKLAAIALPVMFTFAWSLDHRWQSQIHQAIADEVAYNHLAAKPLDIVGEDPNALAQAFSSIGLQLVNAAAQPVNGRLLGARHCSIQSIPAAQLRYVLPKGQNATVYQARYDADRHGRLPTDVKGALQLESRGIDVTLWRDHGVIIAVARVP